MFTLRIISIHAKTNEIGRNSLLDALNNSCCVIALQRVLLHVIFYTCYHQWCHAMQQWQQTMHTEWLPRSHPFFYWENSSCEAENGHKYERLVVCFEDLQQNMTAIAIGRKWQQQEGRDKKEAYCDRNTTTTTSARLRKWRQKENDMKRAWKKKNETMHRHCWWLVIGKSQCVTRIVFLNTLWNQLKEIRE